MTGLNLTSSTPLVDATVTSTAEHRSRTRYRNDSHEGILNTRLASLTSDDTHGPAREWGKKAQSIAAAEIANGIVNCYFTDESLRSEIQKEQKTGRLTFEKILQLWRSKVLVMTVSGKHDPLGLSSEKYKEKYEALNRILYDGFIEDEVWLLTGGITLEGHMRLIHASSDMLDKAKKLAMNCLARDKERRKTKEEVEQFIHNKDYFVDYMDGNQDFYTSSSQDHPSRTTKSYKI